MKVRVELIKPVFSLISTFSFPFFLNVDLEKLSCLNLFYSTVKLHGALQLHHSRFIDHEVWPEKRSIYVVSGLGSGLLTGPRMTS